MKIGEFLHIYWKEHNLSMDELANKCNISKAYISKLEANVNDNNSKAIKPSIQTFNKIATGLHISLTDLLATLDPEQEVSLEAGIDNLANVINKAYVDDLAKFLEHLNEQGKQEAIKRVEELTYIPTYVNHEHSQITNILKIPLADASLSAGTGNILLADNYELIEVDGNKYSNADIAFRVKGDSMEPKYYDGDIVYIHKQPAINIGEIGAFLYNDEQYIKQLIKVDGIYKLHSLNKNYKDIEITKELITYGKVIN